MKNKRNKYARYFQILSGIILLVAFCGFFWFIKTKITCLLDADDSSELVLGHLLSLENKILSNAWYYSSELRVVNTQIFYALFFKIFSSWHRVRVASYGCLYVALIAAYYFVCRGLKIKRYFLITAALLMVPFSEQYFLFVLKGVYYIPHIAITFFTIGLCESYISLENKCQQGIHLIAALLISALAGMGGARQLIILYIPLIITAICITISETSVADEKINCNIDSDDKRYTLFAVVSFIGAAIGYIINMKILSRIYSFKLYDKISFTGFDITKLSSIINGFLSSYGYSYGRVFGIALLRNFLCMCFILLTIGGCIYIIKNKGNVAKAHYRMAIFTLAAFALFVIIYMLTDMGYVYRYNLPIVVLSIPMLAVLFKNIRLKSWINSVAVMAFVLLAAYSGYLFCKEEYKVDDTAELRSITAALQSDGYTKGYTTFWRANVLTELSDGAIEVWTWHGLKDEEKITNTDIDEIYHWLQPVSHNYTHPDGRIFVLFTKNEWDNNPWIGRLSTEHIIYQSDNYIVIGYESYDKLKLDTT